MTPEFTEIMSVRVDAGSRTLYVDLQQNRDASRFLSIREVKHASDARSRILVDEAYVAELYQAIGRVVEFLAHETTGKSCTLAEKRRTHPGAYQPWSEEEDRRLTVGFMEGISVGELARRHARAPSAVERRLERLGLL